VLYTLNDLKNNKDLWKGLELVPVKCSWCSEDFEIKYGTLYNIIRRGADGIYCSRKCAGSGRAHITQNKYQNNGGKACKRCGEFKSLDNFSKLPNPPYLRSECKRCHNFKPARIYSFYKDKALREKNNFDINMDEFINFWDKDCFYCGAKIKKIRLELIETQKGFINNNLVSCCMNCKKFKGDLDHLEFINLCHKISVNVNVKKVEDK
jgi:hypothetical protein